ncbi:MAG: competence/damage-inducible protein CinA C-terminal domain protein [Acidobacteria bacterium]|nr:competence/damage-inducible protein CinA C-terminal domain protein [Acidobacteriota bacterium]
MLSAEIIAIGSELLTPEKTDTNSLWLTEKLNEIGIEVKLKTIVGDDELRLEETIRDAVERSDVIITTGGLGPTEDDITRQISAKAIGRKLIFHEALVEDLRERFRRWGREMPEINKRQAYVIEGAEILPNPNGSAVGMLARIEAKVLVVLPGPPRELKPMFETGVLPELKKLAGEIFVKRKILRVSGMGESAVDEAIAPIYKSFEHVQTSILFNRTEIEIHLRAQSGSESEAENTLEELAGLIGKKLGEAVFTTNGELMEEVVGSLLAENGKTLSVAESCTGGLIGERLTDVSGSSKYFIQGVIAYANEAKIATLNVSPSIIETRGAVSAETAEAMAKGMRELAQTDYAISVTGIAGPSGGSEEKPIGTVFIGYADETRVKSVKILLPGDRYLIRWRASQAALDYLRRQILKNFQG